ncbi:dTDP-4-dehydrorhamnose 3,5-epimerase [Campylobacter coli]|uniref:dTDP-4-dehydrorhamnose 3,5-epimerase n=1 Tax=Campylobacter coli TaxID=195 RepID=UPI0036378358
MCIVDTDFNEVKLIKKKLFFDNRGYFVENFHQEKIEKLLCKQFIFVQENESCSKKNTIRGLHYQMHPFAQTKLINVTSGGILDVIVDLRKNSPTFLEHIKIAVRAEDNTLLFIPRGFAHGFIALEDFTKVSYMVDNFYNPKSERGILYNDPQLKIDWGINDSDVLISDKDLYLPTLEQIRDFFDYNVDYYE